MSDLLPINQEHILLFAMRYALGRRSTAPSIVTREIVMHWPRIRRWTQEQMKDEIRDAIGREEIRDVDRPMWQRVLVLPYGEEIL